jgi:V/A-type H+-transporting ATPase subunit F
VAGDFFAIGSSEIVVGFAYAGVSGRAAETREEALSAFREAVSGDEASYKVLVVTEDVAVLLEEELLEWQMSGAYPLVVEIPGLGGHIEGRKTLIESIREAIGLHV